MKLDVDVSRSSANLGGCLFLMPASWNPAFLCMHRRRARFEGSSTSTIGCGSDQLSGKRSFVRRAFELPGSISRPGAHRRHSSRPAPGQVFLGRAPQVFLGRAPQVFLGRAPLNDQALDAPVMRTCMIVVLQHQSPLAQPLHPQL